MKGPEASVIKAISDYLTLRKYVFKRNQSGVAFIDSGVNGRRAINLGPSGWPDFIGLLPTGRFFGIEVKAGNNKPTEIQMEVLDRIQRSQGVTLVAYSVDDVIKAGF